MPRHRELLRSIDTSLALSHAVGYFFADRLTEGAVGLISRYGRQLWVRSTMRKQSKCPVTGKGIEKKAAAWRPITNGLNRAERISEDGMRLLERDLAESLKQQRVRSKTRKIVKSAPEL